MGLYEGQLPLHHQITNELRDQIKSGKWGVGDLFPTDKDLIEKYEVSSTTVRRAVGQLVQDGLLERKAGKGTFVKKDAIEETLGYLTGFFEEIRRQGFEPSADVINLSRVIVDSKELLKTPQLKLFGTQKLFLVERIQKLDNKPVVYLRSYWPYEYGKELAKHDLTQQGLYDVAAKELGIILTKAEQSIKAGLARKKDAELLGVKAGFPVMIMERVAFVENRPIELSINIYRADRYKYRVVLHKNNQSIEESFT